VAVELQQGAALIISHPQIFRMNALNSWQVRVLPPTA
jgi:hypothetical protein